MTWGRDVHLLNTSGRTGSDRVARWLPTRLREETRTARADNDIHKGRDGRGSSGPERSNLTGLTTMVFNDPVAIAEDAIGASPDQSQG